MSMFYELMMRKKEEIMYATIRGTLTESPEGVFSGFSTSNYLITQQYLKPQNDSWEIKLAVTTGNDITTDQGIASPLGIGINSVLFWCSGGKINIQLYDNINNFFLGKAFNVQANTKYYLKATYIATEQRYIIAYSTDNTNYTVILNSVSDKIINQPDKYYNFGTARGQNRPFLGSIDLNQSYIKLGSTKYNLQAVVGYTVVGSPTITDGVVSGLAYNDYLKINGTYVISSNSNIEFNIRFKVSVLTGNKALFNIGSLWSVPLISVYKNYISGLLIVDMAFENRIEADTYYRLKISMNNGVSKGYLYNDDMSLRAKKTQSLSFEDRTGNIFIGAPYGSTNPTVDSIDLNNTYIKLDNKLWFNGQEE